MEVLVEPTMLKVRKVSIPPPPLCYRCPGQPAGISFIFSFAFARQKTGSRPFRVYWM